MDSSDIGVYGEAKGEYTRQLCVFLVPALETYFLDMLSEAKQTAASPSKELLTFQNMLQGIPDWNQDKVTRETTRIQTDSKCDYLEELVTAVFIAHTKVLSAIRLTSKQKKLQITIPKIEHFLHRVLSECARSLWSSAFLFAGANSLERQKNLRQVEVLLQEAILQAIRGLLPVKSILREYLVEEDEDDAEESTPAPATGQAPIEAGADAEAKPSGPQESEISLPLQEASLEAEQKEESEEKKIITAATAVTPAPEVRETPVQPLPQEAPATTTSHPLTQPPIVTIDSSPRPSVQFNDKAMVFSESGLEEVDLIEEEPQMEDVDTLQISNEVLPMDGFEDLEKPAAAAAVRAPSPIEFEELPVA